MPWIRTDSRGTENISTPEEEPEGRALHPTHAMGLGLCHAGRVALRSLNLWDSTQGQCLAAPGLEETALPTVPPIPPPHLLSPEVTSLPILRTLAPIVLQDAGEVDRGGA